MWLLLRKIRLINGADRGLPVSALIGLNSPSCANILGSVSELAGIAVPPSRDANEPLTLNIWIYVLLLMLTQSWCSSCGNNSVSLADAQEGGGASRRCVSRNASLEGVNQERRQGDWEAPPPPPRFFTFGCTIRAFFQQ